MMDGVLEVELKLRADEAALDALAVLPRLGPAQLGMPHAVEELDQYLDTASGALAAARWACRLRTREGKRWISLKGPAEHADGDSIHRRPEVEGPAPESVEVGVPASTWPASPARDLLMRLAGEEPLHEILRLLQRRRERPVLADGRRVAVLSLDRVKAERDGRALGEMRVVELELVPGVGAGVAAAIMQALRGQAGLRPEPASKLERALRMARGASEAVG